MRTRVFRRSTAELRRGVGPALLLPPAALVVHQLRYLLAYGGGMGAELQRTGHAYLHSVVPWMVLVLALAAGTFLRSLGRAVAGQASLPRRTTSFIGLWLACVTFLVGIFACQELLEGLFVTGHPTGPAGIFGYGGWWAIPASVCVGLVLAACLHGARWVLHETIRRIGARVIRRGRVAPVLRPPRVVPPTPVPVAGGWSGRGPPPKRLTPRAPDVLT